MNSTHVTRVIKASRPDIYQAFITPELIAKWKFPEDMNITIHSFEGREGGTFRVSLTYNDKNREGKTGKNTDTYHGRFVEVIPNEKIVEEEEFETSDPSLQGKMKSTVSFSDVEGGTLVDAVHENLPVGLSPADNEKGWQMSLAKLANLLKK